MSAAIKLDEGQKRKLRDALRSSKAQQVLFRMERDAVLRELSTEKMMALLLKWKQPIPKQWGHPLGPLLVMHAARIQLPSFSIAEKMVSAKFMVKHGYTLPPPWKYVDGKLYGPQG